MSNFSFLVLEIKMILKTIDSKWNLDYDEIFNSKKNIKTYYSLILKLQKIMVLNFCFLINQLLNWLKFFYKF